MQKSNIISINCDEMISLPTKVGCLFMFMDLIMKKGPHLAKFAKGGRWGHFKQFDRNNCEKPYGIW